MKAFSFLEDTVTSSAKGEKVGGKDETGEQTQNSFQTGTFKISS